MIANKEGSHIVTTSSTDGVLLGTAGIYAVTKIAVTGLMEQMRNDLRMTNIGTSNLVPGFTTTNIGRSESYRPEALKNDAPATTPAPRPPAIPARPPGAGAAVSARASTTPMWARPQDPLTVGRLVVNGIINNDMWIFPAPEYQPGVEARGMAMAESMVAFTPMPESIAAGRPRSTSRKLHTAARPGSATYRASEAQQ
jgi:NAD(P)-dependent dehydrogenase (short-subunit alcohol dehydrogenase family)